jgi:hypothetical protein
MDSQTSFTIHGVLSLDHVVLDIAPDPVLRPKQGSEIHLPVLVQNIGRVTQAMVNRRLITYQTHSGAAQQAYSFFK